MNTHLKLTRPLVFLDLETTGTDPATDKIIEIAMYKVIPETVSTLGYQSYDTLVNPGRALSQQVIDLTGINDDMLTNQPSFLAIAASVERFIAGCDIAGYNILNFDVPLLWEEFHRVGLQWDTSQHKFVDSGVIFKQRERRRLIDAVKFYVGESEASAFESDAHDALADVIATQKVLEGQLARYDDLGAMDVAGLADVCAVEELDGAQVVRIDLAGVIVRDCAGHARFTHKKVRGVRVADDLGYANWILGAQFSANTKLEVKKELEMMRKQRQNVFQP